MSFGKHNLFKSVFWLWMFILFSGLNQTLNFVRPDMLLLAMIFFLLIDLVINRAGIIVKLLLSLVLIHRMFYVGSFFNPQWLTWLWVDLGKELSTLLKWDWITPAPITATVLTMLVLMALQRLYTTVRSRRHVAMVLLIVGATLLTGASIKYNGAPGLVVFYVAVGLIVMGTARLQMPVAFPIQRWLSVLLIWVLCLTSVAWAVPSGNLDFSEWYNEFKEYWERAIPGVIYDPDGPIRSRVAYSFYDGILGGPVQNDYTLIMQVNSPVPVYLRGESRGFYTGRGWSSESWYGPSYGPPSYIELRPAHIEGQEITVTVEIIVEQSRVLFVPRYPLSFEFNPNVEVLIMAPPSGPNIYGDYEFRRGALQPGETYTMTILLPFDDPETLRQLTNYMADDRYFQLPADLPQRVTELAQEITSEADNGYDKAVALVNFLRSGKWRYTLSTESTPSEQDFVDWFLFEQDQGYCVHFATAFVVMARAAGLPTRWVKGYSSGVPDERGNYSILNSHAHAWAEVWFDGYGWVPFEPTPGAVLPSGETDDPTPDPSLPQQPDPPREPNRPVPEPSPDGNGREFSFQFSWTWLYIVAALLALVGAGAGIFKVWPRAFAKNVNMIRAYARMQKRLQLFGWQRFNWETPREHLQRVKDLPHRTLFAGFVQRFEDSVYGGAKIGVDPLEHRNFLAMFSTLRLALYRFASRR